MRAAARPLMDAVIASGRATDPDKLDALLADSLPREAVMVGQQAFVLHFRTDAVTGVTAALAVTRAPVHREHDPGKEARVLVMVLAPAREASAFLRGLGAFARAFGKDEIVAAVLAAREPADVLAIPELAAIDLPEDLLVRDVLPARSIAARPEMSLGEAAALMTVHDVPALPVISDEQEVLGLVGYGELLRHLLPAHTKRLSGEFPAAKRGTTRGSALSEPRDTAVRDAMDRSVLCVSEDQTLSDVAALMVNKDVDLVPVVRDGALVGLLTREDIVRRLF